MRVKVKEKQKSKIIYSLLFIVVVIIFVALLILTLPSKKIKEINLFIKGDTKILYIVKDKDYKYSVDILEKYDVQYMVIDNENLNLFERKKLENIIDDDINNMMVIYRSGKIVSKITESDRDNEIVEILQSKEIIPLKIVDNVDSIVDSAKNILDSQYSMVYIPYIESEDIESQNKIFEEISSKYDIDYKKIDAYLLSNNQKEKINSMLDISSVEDQLLVLIKNNKMIANIRGIHRKNTYIESMYDVNFIDELEIKIEEIDYELFESELENKEKSIILIGSKDSKDSVNVFNLLNEMIYNYDISVKYINIEKKDIDTYNKVKEKLEEIKYSGSFSLPLVVIVEANNVLDYAIGNSKEDFFLDIFIENGVIKGDVLNDKWYIWKIKKI